MKKIGRRKRGKEWKIKRKGGNGRREGNRGSKKIGREGGNELKCTN